MSPLDQQFKVGEEREPSLDNTGVILRREPGAEAGTQRRLFPPTTAPFPGQAGIWTCQRALEKSNTSCLLLAWSGQVFQADPPNSMQG